MDNNKKIHGEPSKSLFFMQLDFRNLSSSENSSSWADVFFRPHQPWALRKFPSFLKAPKCLQKKSSGTLLQSGHYLSSHPTFVKKIIGQNVARMTPDVFYKCLRMPQTSPSKAPSKAPPSIGGSCVSLNLGFCSAKKNHLKWQGPRSQSPYQTKNTPQSNFFYGTISKFSNHLSYFFLKCPSCVFFWSKCH